MTHCETLPNGVTVGRSVMNDVSPPLRMMEDAPKVVASSQNSAKRQMIMSGERTQRWCSRKNSR